MAHLIPLGFRRGSDEQETRRISRIVEGEDEDGDGDIEPVRLVGLESRTRVTTAFGEVPAHLLRVNDSVRSADGRFLKIRKIDVLQFDAQFLRMTAEAYPVRIGAGALRTGRSRARHLPRARAGDRGLHRRLRVEGAARP
jgi:hypothetical protein